MGRRPMKGPGMDASRSYMIGDKVADILFGHNIGARSVLVLTGYGRESEATLKENKIHPDFTALTLKEAVDWILHREAGPGGAAQK